MPDDTQQQQNFSIPAMGPNPGSILAQYLPQQAAMPVQALAAPMQAQADVPNAQAPWESLRSAQMSAYKDPRVLSSNEATDMKTQLAALYVKKHEYTQNYLNTINKKHPGQAIANIFMPGFQKQMLANQTTPIEQQAALVDSQIDEFTKKLDTSSKAQKDWAESMIKIGTEENNIFKNYSTDRGMDSLIDSRKASAKNSYANAALGEQKYDFNKDLEQTLKGIKTNQFNMGTQKLANDKVQAPATLANTKARTNLTNVLAGTPGIKEQAWAKTLGDSSAKLKQHHDAAAAMQKKIDGAQILATSKDAPKEKQDAAKALIAQYTPKLAELTSDIATETATNTHLLQHPLFGLNQGFVKPPGGTAQKFKGSDKAVGEVPPEAIGEAPSKPLAPEQFNQAATRFKTLQAKIREQGGLTAGEYKEFQAIYPHMAAAQPPQQQAPQQPQQPQQQAQGGNPLVDALKQAVMQGNGAQAHELLNHLLGTPQAQQQNAQEQE